MALQKKTVRHVNFNGQKVIMRVDYNVSYDEKGEIRDDTRIRATLPTIKYLLKQGASIILISHLGRPKGNAGSDKSLKAVAWILARFLACPVQFADDCIGLDVKAQAKNLQPGEVLLLENLRFHAGEEANDQQFAAELASLADIYVNDAFGMAHRAHASTEGICHHIPSVAGLLLEKELNSLGKALDNPPQPFVAIVGGAKVTDKIAIIENLLNKVDYLLIGGGMANTFLAAQGYNMQKSLIEEDRIGWAKMLLETELGKRIVLPVDIVAAAEFSAEAEHKTVDLAAIPTDWQALDIGPATAAKFNQIIAQAATIIWNGPLGVFEFDNFAQGTFAVAKAVADSKGYSIVGGGDSIGAINKAGLSTKIDHISTGGGAMLRFLEGKPLPAVEMLGQK